ncbi:2232_t:CDS:2 [Acaulospora morrowiae]|uniref:2232_t:CDS:1 n=1 Tax=Acaulospora morrowiae TaxID=94023 RepID=A0A9N9AE89_9GLOM|nr:2232_t:CDS:2 [Acaulospora morrowiae]
MDSHNPNSDIFSSPHILHVNSNTHNCIARLVHSGLYSKKNIQKHVVQTYFDAHAVFENPLIAVESHSEIINIFTLASTFFFDITPEIHSVTDCPIAGNHHIVCIDSVIKYRLPLRLPPIPNLIIPFFCANNDRCCIFSNEINLRIISRFEFNEQKKIVRHEDVWSLKDLVESVPIIGWLYAEVARKATGLVTNGIVMLIQELTMAWNKWEV